MRSALNGGGGSFWASGVTIITVKIPVSKVTFSVTPASAAVTVKDSKDNAITPDSGIYTLVQGEEYSYEIKASGYIGATGMLTPSEPEETVTKALSKSGSGGSSGGSSYSVTVNAAENGSVTANKTSTKGGETVTLTITPAEGYGLTSLTVTGSSLDQPVSCNTNKYTFTMPEGNSSVTAAFEPIVLTLYSKKGENGTKTKAAVFTKTELYAISEDNASGYAYMYLSNEEWRAIVSTKVASIDTLFSAGAISSYWKNGSYLEFTCSDGVYGKSYPYYADINKCQYYVTGSGNYVSVPAGIAVIWDSGHIGNGTARDTAVSKLAESAYDSGSLRFVYGVSQESYTGPDYAAGARSPSMILEMTLVYEASSVPTGTTGTTHNSSSSDNDDTGNTESSGGALIDSTVTESKDSAGNVTVKATVAAVAITDALKSLPAGSLLEITAVSANKDSVSVEVSIPVSGIQAAIENQSGIILTTDSGSIVFDHSALSEMTDSAGSGNITITAALSAEGMNSVQKAVAGDNTVVRLEAKDGTGNSVGKFGSGRAKVTINYSRKDNTSAVKVHRIGDDGSMTDMNASYANGKVQWDTDSFSYYMISEAEAVKGLPFTDIAPDDWYYGAVSFVYERGLFNGATATTFEPDSTMTRAMLVTVLHRIDGQTQAGGSVGFKDVSDPSAYYYNAVLWAVKNGIIIGYSDSVFGADDPVTREQMVTILYRYAKYKNYDVSASASLSGYTDEGSIGAWALDAVKWAVVEGLINGTSDTVISPASGAARAQVAVILQRFIENIAE